MLWFFNVNYVINSAVQPSDSDVVQHSSSRELPRATASLGLNTCDPEAVQLDPAMNLDQSQCLFPGAAVANANY